MFHGKTTRFAETLLVFQLSNKLASLRGFPARWPVLACCLLATAIASPLRAQGLVAYRGATIETLSDGGRLEDATLLVRDGVIEEVGADVKIPETAKVVDATGQTLMPALVDAYHPIRLGSGASQPATQTITIRGRTFRVPRSTSSQSGPFLRIADNLDPLKIEDELTGLARLGVGMANLVTSGYGQAAHARVTPQDPAQSLANGDGYLYLPLTNDSSSLQLLRTGLTGQPTRGSARGSRGGGRPGGRGGGGRRGPAPSAAPTRSSGGAPVSAAVELWKKVKDGETRVIVNVNNAAAILHLLAALKDSDDVQVVLVANGDHIYQTLDALKDRQNLSVVIRPDIETEPTSAIRVNVARMLEEAKVNFAFSLSLRNDTAALVDAPLFPVAMLVRTGLDRDVALRALTIRPAEILGVDKSVGSLEKGKKANVLFVEGDPLDPASHIRQLMVEGRVVHEG